MLPKPKYQSTRYRVIFMHKERELTVVAKNVYQSDLFGFIEIEDIDLEKRLVVTPEEELILKEFASVKRTFIPVQNVLRIDEIMQES